MNDRFHALILCRTSIGVRLAAVVFASTLFLSTVAHSEPPAKPEEMLVFKFALTAAKDEEGDKLPFFRVFPGGKDSLGEDATGTLRALKLARGASKLYKDEDAKAGLMVVLRRLLFVPQEDGSYKAILEGEYNAVQVPVTQETVAQLRGGEPMDLVFESNTTKGIRPLAFRIQATTKLRVSLRDGELRVYECEGKSTITQYSLMGDFTYVSDPITLPPSADGKPIFTGRTVKPVLKSNDQPETLPVIN